MGVALKIDSYPYIGSDPGIANGAPLIEGTRIKVRTIAGYYQLGMTVDDILASLTHLTQSQVHCALAYYFDHQEEIDADRDRNDDLDLWKAQVIPHSKAQYPSSNLARHYPS